MPRSARAEIFGGLYHVITRGNNRRRIFNHVSDYQKFLSVLAVQKVKLPFFLYAYCLMSNHVHLLIERQTATIGRIMQRLLTAMRSITIGATGEWGICFRAGTKQFSVRAIALSELLESRYGFVIASFRSVLSGSI